MFGTQSFGEVIVTPRLRISPFAEQFLTTRYVTWLNDPEVVKFSDQRFRRHTLESCREYWQSFAGSPNYFWAITCVDCDLGHIGNMNAYVQVEHGLADVGIVIGEKQAWGKGYGLEAWLGVVDYLFRTAGMRKVTAGTLSVNKPMLKIMERLGMKPDGRRESPRNWNGGTASVVYGGLFKEDWCNQYPNGPFA